MNRNVAILICVLIAAIALTGGFALRATTSHSTSPGNAGEASSGVAGSFAKSSEREVTRVDVVRNNVERAQGSRHWLHWMAGIEEATLDELPGLARLAHDNQSALQLIAYRWMELDSDHLLKTLIEEGRHFDPNDPRPFPLSRLGSVLFREWPKRDLEAAIEALSGPDPLAGRESWRINVLTRAMNRDPKRGLELMTEWGIHNFGAGTTGVEKWARRDPAAAAQAVLDNPAGFGAYYSMMAVAKVWAGSDPEAAMDFAIKATGSMSGPMRELVLAQWAGQDLEAASNWLAAQENDALRSRLSPFIVKAWAKGDPQTALAWCEANLSGHRLVTAVGMLAKGAVEADAQTAAILVAGMDSSPARTRAAVTVAESWFPRPWASDGEVPPAAVEWFHALDDPEVQGAVLEKVARGWAAHDREGLMEFLVGEGAEGVPSSAYRDLMDSFAREDPQAALAWAADLPPERVKTASEAAFSVWTSHQPAAALEWLREVPATDPRHEPMMTSYIRNALWQNEAIAVQRLRELPASAHDSAREQIERAGIPGERKARLMQALGE